ncbi:deoxynucleoside kinase [bacterium]|nr:deoxynucleoside kinase [bacterium]
MFIVEGNIGTGKSTLLDFIAKHIPTISIAPEFIENWNHTPIGHHLLESFYQDPVRWALTMEMESLTNRIQQHLHNQEYQNALVVERSIYSGYYCFAKNGYEQGFLTELEWNVYNAWFKFTTEKKCKLPQGFIYLQADPEVSYKRTLKRARAAEQSISKDYLQQIHEKHEQFLIHKKDVSENLKHIPTLTLDWNIDAQKDAPIFEKNMNTLQDFIHSYSL